MGHPRVCGALTGIAFAEVACRVQADVHVANCDLGTTGLCQTEWGYSYDAGGLMSAYWAEAYVYLDNVQFAAAIGTSMPGSSGYETLLHEIGHALGLDHPFDTPWGETASRRQVPRTGQPAAARTARLQHRQGLPVRRRLLPARQPRAGACRDARAGVHRLRPVLPVAGNAAGQRQRRSESDARLGLRLLRRRRRTAMPKTRQFSTKARHIRVDGTASSG